MANNIFEIFKDLENQWNTSVNYLKNLLPINIERINLHVGYIKDEIELRTESLKVKLDDMNLNYQNELDKFKEELIEVSIQENNKNQVKLRDYEALFEKTSKLKDDVNDCFLNKTQAVFKDLEKLVAKAKNWDFYVGFNVSEENLNESIIGKLKCGKNYEKQNKQVKVKLENTEIEVVNLQVRPVDICTLPNKTLVCVNSTPWNLTLYDENFNNIRTIDRISGREIKPVSLTTNDKNVIFIACIDEIIATDLEFNEIFKCGSTGSDIEQFKYPSSIAFKEDYLYVCDRNNKRLQKLFSSESSEITFIENYILRYKPDQIKVSNAVACVRQFIFNSLYFYDLNSFELKFKYDHLNGSISEIGGIFYAFDFLSAKICCYETDGCFLNEILNFRFKDLTKDFSQSSGKIILFNNSILMSDNTSLIRFH